MDEYFTPCLDELMDRENWSSEEINSHRGYEGTLDIFRGTADVEGAEIELEVLKLRLKYISANRTDGVAVRYALEASQSEIWDKHCANGLFE